MGTRARIALVVAALAVAACTRTASGDADVVASTTSTLPPVTTTTSTAPPTTTVPDGCPDPGPLAAPDPHRPVYSASATIDAASGTVDGTLSVHFTPDRPVDELVFRLWANAPNEAPAGAHIDVAGLGGAPLPPDPSDATILHTPIGATAPADVPIDVGFSYHLVVPGNDNDRVAHDGDSLRLGSFLPLLAWEPGHGWATEPPTVAHGEAATSPVADYDVAETVPDG